MSQDKKAILNNVLNTIIEGLKKDLKNEFRTDNIFEMNKMIIELTNKMKQNNQPDNVCNNTSSSIHKKNNKLTQTHIYILLYNVLIIFLNFYL